MSPTLRILLASTLLAHAAGCATDTSTPPSPDDKDEFRDSDGKTDNGLDVCEAFDWYGDGECDAFCVQRDTDCATDARTPELPPADALASKITMARAAYQVEQSMGTLIEAKFEHDHSGNLALSLYPLGKSVSVDATNNVFQEAAGDPTATTFAPGLEVFHDFEHLSRSTRDLTIVQLSKLTLRDAIARGSYFGFVYWAIPTMQAGRAGYGIYAVDDDGDSQYVFIDGQGSRVRQVADLGTAPTNPTDDRHPELGNDPTIVRTSKITMLQAIDQLEAQYGKMIEAKFELDHSNNLALSLYPVKDYRLDAERNELGELAGDPTAASFSPSYSKFDVPDEEHVTKASRDLSLVQASGMNLRSAVAKVQAKFPGGFIYWAIPTRKGTRAGYGIYVLDKNNRTHYLFVS
ncbi:MAG TPA: hypothetical protein VMZ53_01295 [Kofleriaceae bacterium]|nr:hypothetical protein [Kofleriaceae bacterium]